MTLRTVTTRVAPLLLLAVLLPGLASAQMREFKGRVTKITRTEITVESHGDPLTFQAAPDVAVEGEEDTWLGIARGAWVIVSWKMMDTPRLAYKVVVLPKQDAE